MNKVNSAFVLTQLLEGKEIKYNEIIYAMQNNKLHMKAWQLGFDFDGKDIKKEFWIPLEMTLEEFISFADRIFVEESRKISSN